jgi:hypothetical protein
MLTAGNIMSVFFDFNWLREDGAKLFFFFSCVLGVFALARWVSSKSESPYGPPAPSDQEPNLSFVPDPDGDLHPRMRIGGVEIRSFYFKTFNALTGPLDPESFCDELTVEVEHLDTGNRSLWGFTVGTPEGFAALLREKNWKLFYSPAVFVFERYDLERIRAAVVERIQLESTGAPEDTSDSAGSAG